MTVFLAEGPVSPWKSLAKGLAMLIEEMTINAEPDGLKIFGMGRDHINAIDISFDKHSFKQYECSISTKLTMLLPDLVTVLDNAEDLDDVILCIKDSVDDGVDIQFKGKFNQDYNVHLVDPKIIYDDKRGVKPSEITRVKIDRLVFVSALDKISKVSDQIKLVSTTDGTFCLKAKSDSLSKSNIELPKESFTYGFVCTANSECKYFVDKILAICRLLKNSSVLEVTFANGYPIVILADLDKSGSKFSFMQGPLIVD